MKILAPIALFVYNRPWHTKCTVEALQVNNLADKSELIIFSDGPRGNEIDNKEIRKVRDYLKNIKGFMSVRVIERNDNLGLAASIINGVDQVLEQYETIIVLEDDLVTSPFFLEYMNNGLNIYAHNDQVISIHGYSYPIDGLPANFFLKGADCWGWGTWKREWEFFEGDGLKLLEQLKSKKLLRRFDFNGTYNYTEMLIDQIEGKNDSWAIRWYASALIHDKLTLYPGKSLIRNIGLDGSGRHCGNNPQFNTIRFEKQLIGNKILAEESAEAFRKFQNFFSGQNTSVHKKKIYCRVKDAIRGLCNE